MITATQSHFREALFLENRGFSEEAKKHFDQLIPSLHLLDASSLTVVSRFYESINEFEIVIKSAKLGISKIGDIRELAPLFIYAWEQVSQDVSQLEWLLKQPGFDHLPVERLIIARHLFTHGKVDKAYMLSLEVAETTEREFRENPSGHEFYIHALLNLIEIEYSFQNFTQARFHLRKLIYLNKDHMTRIQDIAYWAAVLDEIGNFVLRSDWNDLKLDLAGDVSIICQFYYQLSQNSLTKNLVEQIKNNPFQDDLLETKRISYLFLVKKLNNAVGWSEGIEEAHLEAPDDLLTSLLYSDYLKTNRPEDVKEYWKQQFPKHADRTEAVKAYWHGSKNVDKSHVDLDDVSITFFGGGEKIGGTSILITVKDSHLLLDAGMHLHEESVYPDYSPLHNQNLSLEDIDALLISHAHMDHTGAVPYVHSLRKDLPIYATGPTVSLMKLLLMDTVRIGRETSSNMYSEEDVHNALLSINPVEFNKTFTVTSKESEWKITYYPSGHILGAGAIHIEFEGVSILFTGDYSIDDQKTVRGLSLPDDLKVDVLITESTYGFLPTNASMNRTRQEKLFIESINRTMDKGGNMLIPAFALGRAQEIILILKHAFKEEKYLPFNLYLDGRVTDVCKVYERYLKQGSYRNSAFHQNSEESPFFSGGVQAAQEIYSNRRNSDFQFDDFIEGFISQGNNCIVASSGMLAENSASARYAEHLIEEERNAVSFTGYMDEESPGHHVLKSSKNGVSDRVKINGKEKGLNAKIESFRLSAHASREQILQLIADLQPQQVFLMHGEHNKKYSPTQTIVGGEKIYPTLIDLLDVLKHEIDVIPAYNGEKYYLDKRSKEEL
ncbi:MBL fold metallo-hydrolase [Rossellomorea vietnamensis]|uniref:MBL fold metallo-hydrolase n=1 Tax=Rossellomorea vietnamensis TaxID=218284 RepID=UPI00077C5C3D|nr:MBL fold metallo-hydrolase [Rossellomorea vietnamensis]